MTEMDMFAGALGVLTSFVAAVFWFWASWIKVPNNQNTFISVLQKIGWLNARGAGSACIAAICAVYGFARSIGWI